MGLLPVRRADGLRSLQRALVRVEDEERGTVERQAEARGDAGEHGVHRVVEVRRLQHLAGQGAQGGERRRLGGEGLEGAAQRGRLVEDVEDAGAQAAQVGPEIRGEQAQGAIGHAHRDDRWLSVGKGLDAVEPQRASQRRELDELTGRERDRVHAPRQARLELTPHRQPGEQGTQVRRYGGGEDGARQRSREKLEPAVGHDDRSDPDCGTYRDESASIRPQDASIFTCRMCLVMCTEARPEPLSSVTQTTSVPSALRVSGTVAPAVTVAAWPFPSPGWSP